MKEDIETVQAEGLLEDWPRLRGDQIGKPVAQTASDFAVGSVAFYLDGNNRTYKDGKLQRRHCYTPALITDETKQSWITGRAKWDKKTLGYRGDPFGIGSRLMGLAEALDHMWVSENRVRIARAVEGADAATLRAIDSILSAESPAPIPPVEER
jgi:hypothetical protein